MNVQSFPNSVPSPCLTCWILIAQAALTLTDSQKDVMEIFHPLARSSTILAELRCTSLQQILEKKEKQKFSLEYADRRHWDLDDLNA